MDESRAVTFDQAMLMLVVCGSSVNYMRSYKTNYLSVTPGSSPTITTFPSANHPTYPLAAATAVATPPGTAQPAGSPPPTNPSVYALLRCKRPRGSLRLTLPPYSNGTSSAASPNRSRSASRIAPPIISCAISGVAARPVADGPHWPRRPRSPALCQ